VPATFFAAHYPPLRGGTSASPSFVEATVLFKDLLALYYDLEVL
jgi:hypothetical protein